MSKSIEMRGERFNVLISSIADEQVKDELGLPTYRQLNVSIWTKNGDPEEPGTYSGHVLNADDLALLLRGDGDAGNKVELLVRLSTFRREMEAALAEDGADGLSLEQATMMCDMCRALGLVDAEIKYVLGEAFEALMDARLFYPVIEVPAGVLRQAQDRQAQDKEVSK